MEAALVGHLGRLVGASVIGIVVGTFLWRRGSDERWRAFGGMTLAWSAVGLIIGLLGRRDPAVPDARAFREFLTFNLGLNLGYVGVGVALVCFPRPAVRGAGWAVALQGAMLFLLDGWLWWATR